MFFCEFFGSVSWEELASRKIKLKKSFPDQPKIFEDGPPSFEPRHNTPIPLTATENFPWNVSGVLASAFAQKQRGPQHRRESGEIRVSVARPTQ